MSDLTSPSVRWSILACSSGVAARILRMAPRWSAATTIIQPFLPQICW